VTKPIEYRVIHQKVERELKVVHNTVEVAEVLEGLGLSSAVQEELWVVLLDGARQVLAVYPVGKGGYHDCDISIPTIIAPVFLGATDRFIIAHNHPSGDTNPTQHDLELTWRINQAADILDLMFEDHIIVTPKGQWHSMRGSRQMRPKGKSKVASS
jgi:DNA repair protein RadC